MNKRIVTLTVLIGIFWLCSFAFAQDKSSRIQYLYIDQIKYISVNSLVEIYGGELDWNYMQKKAYWEVNEHRVVLALFSPYVLVDGKTYNLGYEVKFHKGAMYVPLKNFYPLLRKVKAEETKLEEETQSLMLDEESRVTEVNASKKLNGILIEVFLSEPVTYEVFLPGHDWLNINFYHAEMDTAYFAELEIPGIVNQAKAFQFENSAQLSLLLNKSYDIFSHSLISDPYRIQISLEDTSSQFTQSHLAGIAEKTDVMDVVIIDPGHGGDDPGNVGPEGLTEKEVVLDIARRLERLFREDSNTSAYLTRDSDIPLPIEQRARFANEKGGDILLSLHTNFSLDPTEGGFQIFIPGEAKTKKDSMVQVLENRPSEFNSGDEIAEALSDLDNPPYDTGHGKFVGESEALALLVQEELEKVVHTENRGISQADFLLLRKAYMPGILIQIVHISSPYEELLLREEIFRQWVAEALYKAVIRFQQSSPESL